MELVINIIEAVKSGKRFKRICSRFFYPATNEIVNEFEFDREDVLADDWEVEEKKVEITKEQLEKALNKAYPHGMVSYGGPAQIYYPMLKILYKELGLE